jgi:hypothetical protein
MKAVTGNIPATAFLFSGVLMFNNLVTYYSFSEKDFELLGKKAADVSNLYL